MIDLVEMFNDTELKYIINVIPTPGIRNYFKRYPKDFQKTFPGFRVNATIPAERYLIEIKRNNDFIVNLVTSFLEQSVKEIDEAIEESKKESDLETALIKTLSCSHFSDNPNIYFKLKNEENENDANSILLAAIKMYGELSKENNSLKNEYESLKKQFDDLHKKISEQVEYISSLQTAIETYKSINKELSQNLEKISNEIKNLEYANGILKGDYKKTIDEIEVLKTKLSEAKEKNSNLQNDMKSLFSELESLKIQRNVSLKNEEELKTRIEILSADIESKNAEIAELEEKLAKTIELHPTITDDNFEFKSDADISRNQITDIIPTIEVIKEIEKKHSTYLFVKDYEEFKMDLDYCLMDANVNEGKEVLTSYMDRLYTERKIIIGNRKDCRFIVECFSSILCSNEYTTITYFDGIKLRDIITAVENGGRIIYLDNFIGNYNETVLISLLSIYMDKMIVISAMYDKMFMYVTSDILRDCNYINLQRLNLADNINFDSCVCEEQISEYKKVLIDNAPTSALISILRDLKLNEQVRTSLSINVNSHTDSDAILTFGVLPYLVDVRGETPFENSDRLLSYYEKNRNNRFTLKWFIYG